jgi:hypothetical protein
MVVASWWSDVEGFLGLAMRSAKAFIGDGV